MEHEISIFIYKGRATRIEIEIRDERDEREDFTGVQASIVTIKNGSTNILVSEEDNRDNGRSVLAIDLTEEQTLTLPVGILMLGSGMKFDDVWYECDAVYVNVLSTNINP